MKKLDKLIIRSFVGPFVVTFFVTLFVLVMQFFWLYMDELIGKGLGVWMILQLLLYISSTLVPLALPLGVLLASIMTFGNLGENFELVAIKSSGISLLRFMRPLLVFMIFVSGAAFVFSNNVIPVANLKALSLLYDLRNSKPTFNIRAGQFNNDIKGFSIRVGSKDPDGKTIRDIIIYDQSSGYGNDKVILAEKGQMIPSADKQSLIFRMNNGWRYEEQQSQRGANRNPQMRLHFESWDKVFDISSFKVTRTNQDLFKNAYQMMNVSQLTEGIDSMKRKSKTIARTVSAYLAPYQLLLKQETENKDLLAKVKANAAPIRTFDSTFNELIPDSLKASTLQLSVANLRSIKNSLDMASLDSRAQKENYIRYNVEWHKKFVLSFACILLFLIGAPLGAIIRKGGLGMPLVIAVLFFVVFHITSVTGEKLAESAVLPAWAGMWMATAMLLPIAIVLIQQARNDSQIFSKEWYTRIWTGMTAIVSRSRKKH
ncbi:MAG: LptF/LptG family permease [Flavipsychrobacter sp.]|nr:LptF/LptG family permease [Flavipsychrobacter sp.]